MRTKNGREKALAEISNAHGKFADRDLYVTVYTLDGVCLAHINGSGTTTSCSPRARTGPTDIFLWAGHPPREDP